MSRADHGFTLIELLVALMLATLVAMLAYGGLHVALRSWDAAELRQQDMEQRYLTQALLRRLLESPVTLRVRDEEDHQQVAFFGEEEGLIFAAHLPVLGDSKQLYWVQLVQDKQFTAKGLAWQLELRYLPFDDVEKVNWALLAKALASNGKHQVLIEGEPSAWHFGYLERLPEGELDWQSQWQQQPGLPVLLRLTPPKGRRASAAQLLVAPKDMAYAIVKDH